MAKHSDDQLERAYDELEREVPDRVARAIRWLRDPKSRWVRIPLGVLLIGLSFLAVLPVIGIELLPLGLMLVAQDIPFLRAPIGRFMLWLEHRWLRLKRSRRKPPRPQ